MKYTVIFGSPRIEGNTKAIMDVVLKKLEAAGGQVDLFDVYDMKIGGCRACLGCQSDMDEICCVINDDMQQIMASVSECDMLIIAAPVYVWSLPAPVKAAVDRLVYSGCKYYGNDPDGPSLFEGMKLAIIATCGYPVEKGADLLEEQMRRYCRHTGMKFAGILCERHRNLKEPFMDNAKAIHAEEFAETLISAKEES